MTKEELIRKYEKEIEVRQKNIIESTYKAYRNRNERDIRQFLLFIDDIKQLNEETRKDFVVLYCPECGSQEVILGERINRCSNCKHVWNRAI